MKKSKTTAALIALLGGVFGLHKFYLNDPGSGFFYAIAGIVTRGIFGFPVTILVGVLDAIRLFSMSEQRFNKKYNSESSRRRRSTSGSKAQDRTTRDMRSERERYRYNEKITKKQRDNPFRRSADKKYKEFDLEGALTDYAKASEITPADSEMHFSMAGIYSLMENTDKSLHHLEQAMKMGFEDLDLIKNKDELAFLRIQPEYDAFVANGYIRVEKYKPIEPPKEDLLQDDVLLSQLNKLKELRSKGMLSQKEYAYEKEKLMKR